MSQRKIIHVDMDCFYAAVEVKHRPHLKGKAIGIGGPANSRGVLCTASYEARKFGVRSAMPSSQAMRLCPHLILIPPNFSLYKEESRSVRKILERYTNLIEPLSLDEAYLDVSACEKHGGSATLIAQEIRAAIEKELNLTASAGIAPNKFLAKIASDWKKPNGQFVVKPEEVADFVRELPVEKIRGVGKVTAKKMHDLGLKTCADLQKKELHQLIHAFGSWAVDLKDMANGIDDRPVTTSSERKSLSVEETFAVDRVDLSSWLAEIPPLYESWELAMLKLKDKSRIRGIVVKVKYQDFRTATHETACKDWPTANDFKELLRNVWEKRSDPVRLIGIGVRLGESEKRSDSSQLSFAI